MIRLNSLGNHLSGGFVAIAVCLYSIGCSDSSSTGGSNGFPGQGPGPTPGQGTAGPGASMQNPSTGSGASTKSNANSAAPSSGGSSGASTPPAAGGSSGAMAGGSSGAPASGSSSGSMGAMPSGIDAGTAAVDAGTTGPLGSLAGCGQGTSCMPGNDLPPPASDADGFQVATPDGGITVQPGEEQFLCYYKNMPNTTDVNVGAFQSWMTPGSSHHFIAYQQGSGPFGGTTQPDGTLNSCGFGGGTWVYATSLPGTIVEMKMPQGVGLPFAAGSQIMLNMHFINPGSSPVSPVVKMNMLYVSNIQYQAAAMTSFNNQINVPAATAAGPGTQTVQGTCTAPTGSNFFIVTTHTHKHATLAQVSYVSGGTTTNLVNTTDWEHPDVRFWTGPNFLTIQQGDSFTYSCSYENDSNSPVTVGETAASNEMCMEIAYYFPAGQAFCQ